MVDKHGKDERQRIRKAQAGTKKATPAKKAARKAASAKQRRPRHPDGDYERLLKDAEARKWTVTKDEGYFKCLCACADKCFVSVVLTPSSQRTLMNTRKRLERCEGW